MSVRLVAAPISLEFDLVGERQAEYEREYHQLSESDDDPISQWLKLAKARGETAESDPVLLNLMVELHRKIDNVERLIKHEAPVRISLHYDAVIESIGYGYFQLEKPLLQPQENYYGRIEMPVHPRHDVGVFFKAENKHLAHIVKMHERDEKEWGSYLTARERVMIREMKGS